MKFEKISSFCFSIHVCDSCIHTHLVAHAVNKKLLDKENWKKIKWNWILSDLNLMHGVSLYGFKIFLIKN